MLQLSNLGIDHLVTRFPPLGPLVADTAVTEIMIVTDAVSQAVRLFYERRGRLHQQPLENADVRSVRGLCMAIARPQGDDPNRQSLIDARLADGSRVAICVPPASPSPAVTIRRFSTDLLTAGWLVQNGSLAPQVLDVLREALLSDRNVLVSGGTGSGKTTLLNALIQLLPGAARILVVEDTMELKVEHPNTVRLEARDLDFSKVSHADLVRHALRHRPDHIVVGEIRGAEAADVLQALNTGHGGSLTTIHANSARQALLRLATCAQVAASRLPWEVICRQATTAFHYVVQQHRRPNGSRGVRELVAIKEYDVRSGDFDVETLWSSDTAGGAALPPRAVIVAPGTPRDLAPPPAVRVPGSAPAAQPPPAPAWRGRAAAAADSGSAAAADSPDPEDPPV